MIVIVWLLLPSHTHISSMLPSLSLKTKPIEIDIGQFFLFSCFAAASTAAAIYSHLHQCEINIIEVF